jgi:hypothetical protein
MSKDPSTTYVTIAQARKDIFPEYFKSLGSIHVPMQERVFCPEVLGTAPTPSKLSVSDLVTIFLLHMWFRLGVRYKDLKAPAKFVHDPDSNTLTPVFLSSHCLIFLPIDNFNPLDIWGESRKKPSFLLGPDRIIQRVFDTYGYELVSILRRITGPNGSVYHIVLGSSAVALAESRSDTTEAEITAMAIEGFTEIRITNVYRHVMKRLEEI